MVARTRLHVTLYVHCLYFFYIDFWPLRREKDFSLLQSTEICSGTHPVPIQCVLETLSPGVRRPWREADYTSAQCRGHERVDLYLHIPYALTACTRALSFRAQCKNQTWMPHLHIILNWHTKCETYRRNVWHKIWVRTILFGGHPNG